MKCLYFEDDECESKVININQCNKCMIFKNTKLLKSFEERLSALEKPSTKKTGRTSKAKMVG